MCVRERESAAIVSTNQNGVAANTTKKKGKGKDGRKGGRN